MAIKSDIPYLQLIEKYIGRILLYTQEMTFDEFTENQMVYDACPQNFTNIAEMFKKNSDPFKTKHPEIPFINIISLRNIAAHSYEGLNPEILFQTIQLSIPELQLQIKNILRNEPS